MLENKIQIKEVMKEKDLKRNFFHTNITTNKNEKKRIFEINSQPLLKRLKTKKLSNNEEIILIDKEIENVKNFLLNLKQEELKKIKTKLKRTTISNLSPKGLKGKCIIL